MKAIALVACAALATGCFAYDRPAKKWAYFGDGLIMVAGGGAIAADLLTRESCTGAGCPTFDPPFGGGTVAGVVLVTAGIIGIAFTSTRTPVKTSR